MSAEAPSLTVVLPVFNGAGWVARSIRAADEAILRSAFQDAEIVVVDDGSMDTTVDEAKNLSATVPVRIISQQNQGRFAARRTGLDEAQGDFVLFVDARVQLHPDSLSFVGPYLTDPAHQVWTAHVDIETKSNPIARFWRAIEHVAWRRYHGNPRHVRYGIEEFDFYPKGTTALLCPQHLIAAAYADFKPTVADLSKVNDDTALLRYVARRQPINIAPGYSCTYNARSTMRSFLKHAHHRGAVLIDGYLQPGARFAHAIKVVLALTPVGLVIAVRHPKLVAGSAIVAPAAAAAAARVRGAYGKDAVVLGALAIPFGASYLTGMWRGVISRIRLRWSSAAAGRV